MVNLLQKMIDDHHEEIKSCRVRSAERLIAEEPLDAIHRDHKLIGNWQGRRECHIESDWLLIYKIESDRIIFERTGTHSDLFEK